MRDLSTRELSFVYGAGLSPMPPSRQPKAKKAKRGDSIDDRGKRNRGGSSDDRNRRCGKGGSS